MRARTVLAVVVTAALLLAGACGDSTVGTAPLDTNASEPSPEGTSAEEAGNADVVHVVATRTADGVWTFEVTVEHPDTGWESYADGWDVVTPDGEVLKARPDDDFTRVLLHPHVEEQPFTRSRSGIEVPADVTSVVVRAHDHPDGFGGREVTVDLDAESGPGFEVVR